MERYNLFLDDIRDPEGVASYIGPENVKKLYEENKWVVVRNYDDFLGELGRRGLPDLVSFDHDLSVEMMMGEETGEKSGLDCAKALIDYCIETNKKLPTCIVHSLNPVGKENITELLKAFRRSNG